MKRPFADEMLSQNSVGHVRGLRYSIVVVSVSITLYHALVGRTGVFLFLDELHSLANLDRGFAFLLSLYDTHGSGIALPLLQRMSVDLCGAGLFAYRLPALLGALGAMLLCYPVAMRLVGRVPAMIATLALSSNTLFIYYSKVARSYSLAVCLVLAVVLALHVALANRSPGVRPFIALAVCLGLAPYVHLGTAAVLMAVIAAGFATAVARGEGATLGRRLLISAAGGAMLAGLLHLPALGPISSFLGGVVEGRENEFVHDLTYLGIVGETLAGGSAAAIFWSLSLPIAVLWYASHRRGESFILIAAALSSPAVVMLLTPRGAPIAWARYMLLSTPFILMLLAWMIAHLVRLLPIPRGAAERLALVVGGILVLFGSMFGPLGVEQVEDGRFSNSYLSARPIAANNVAWTETPAFYRMLATSAGGGSIIEAPVLSTRRVYLYRNYFLQHGREVLMGTLGLLDGKPGPSVWPYIPLLDEEAIRGSGAEYLIVHLNVEREAAAYEAFVSRTDREPRARRTGLPKPRHGLELSDFAADLDRVLGEPVFRDDKIVAWKL